MKNKVQNLIVDTSAFIKNVSLQEYGEHVTTVQEVVDEIKNKRQLRRLVVLPYDLKISNVFPENVKYITEFSKKTGDYPSLSATDIKVLALTYQLEKEKVGTDHLRTEPQINRTIEFTKFLPEEAKAVPGFHFPNKKGEEKEGDAAEATVESLTEKIESLDCNTAENLSENHVSFDDILVPIKKGVDCKTAENLSENNALVDDILVPIKKGEVEEEVEHSDDDDDEYVSANEEEEEEEEEDDDNDDDGWITPENITHVKMEFNSVTDTEKPIQVACITSDFAMQNVLKQIGLNVLSLEGRQIQQLRTFILRCYACFKTTSIMTKTFCPNCGNKTLKKVAVSVNEDGTQVIHISSRKRLTARGKRFSLPTPKGGKHANNPILCEDQRIPDQRPSRLARTKNNPLDPDYIAGFSPFVMRDVNSKSAMLGIRNMNPKALARNDNRRKKKK